MAGGGRAPPPATDSIQASPRRPPTAVGGRPAEMPREVTTSTGVRYGPAPRGPGYLIPVVAMPLTRYRWPSMKAISNGSNETTDMANIAP